MDDGSIGHCAFSINKMDVCQFARVMADNDFADQVLLHIERCLDHAGPDIKAKFALLLENFVAREGIHFLHSADGSTISWSIRCGICSGRRES